MDDDKDIKDPDELEDHEGDVEEDLLVDPKKKADPLLDPLEDTESLEDLADEEEEEVEPFDDVDEM